MNHTLLLRLGALSLLLASVACGDEPASTNPGDTQEEEETKKPDAGQAQTDPPPASEATETPPATETPAGEPDVDTIAWEAVGNGVEWKDTMNTRGNSAALLYVGFKGTIDGSKAWASALYKSDLKERGVRYLFAIRGPNQATYANKEIGNSKIVASLLPKIDDKTNFILLVAHSSGSYVAHEFLTQVSSGGKDPDSKMSNKLVYFNLDGSRTGLTKEAAAKTKRTYWVSPRDTTQNLAGLNPTEMTTGAQTYPELGGLMVYNSSEAGCQPAAARNGCVSDSVIISKPHDPKAATPEKDYSEFSDDRKVVTKYLADRATEAGLAP